MTIIALDTETLGLDPDTHAVWEVAGIRYDETTDTVEGTFLRQIRMSPQQIERGDPDGMRIGGFDDRYDPTQAVALTTFLDEFLAFTAVPDGQPQAHLCGAVSSFDEERLRRLALRHGYKPNWHYHLIDVENLAIGCLAAAGVRTMLPWKSDVVSETLGVRTPTEAERHTAMGDAEWALRLYRRVMLGEFHFGQSADPMDFV